MELWSASAKCTSRVKFWTAELPVHGPVISTRPGPSFLCAHLTSNPLSHGLSTVHTPANPQPSTRTSQVHTLPWIYQFMAVLSTRSSVSWWRKTLATLPSSKQQLERTRCGNTYEKTQAANPVRQITDDDGRRSSNSYSGSCITLLRRPFVRPD